MTPFMDANYRPGIRVTNTSCQNRSIDNGEPIPVCSEGVRSLYKKGRKYYIYYIAIIMKRGKNKNFEFWEGCKKKTLNAVGLSVGVAPFSVGPLQGSNRAPNIW